MLKSSVTKFNDDLNQLSSHIKSKQTSQIRQTLKAKSFQQAGLANKIENVKPATIQIHHQQQQPVIIQEQVIFQPQTIKIEQQLPEVVLQNPQPSTSSQITLNRLNAQQEELEMDDEEYENDVKIEFSHTEEVSSI